MRIWIAAILAFVIIAPAHAASDEDEIFDEDLLKSSMCREGLVSKCWKPMADKLPKLKEPVTDKQRESQFIAYWVLAKDAEFVGDLQDSKRFYTTVLDLADGMKGKDQTPDQMRMIVLCDAAELALHMHDYALALSQVDEVLAHDSLSDTFSNPLLLFRAAALIGLGRLDEADKNLNAMLQRLDYAGIRPWEGWPFGPAPLDPYDAARRVAAHYVREHRYEEALALLKMLEAMRQKTLAESPSPPPRGGYWASWIESQDLMDDEADVYIAQGNDDEAEKVLKASLAIREQKSPNREMRKVLEHLSALAKRHGRIKESEEFSQRAAALAIKADLGRPDPLKDTLDLPNSKGYE